METIKLNKEEVYEYIAQAIQDARIRTKNIGENKFHHNTSYEDAPSIIDNGILSLAKQQELGIKKYDSKLLTLMNDTTSHINGKTGISIAATGLKDIYYDEEVYDPFCSHYVDFIISDEINTRTRRASERYGNEFIVQEIIPKENLKSVDIRITRYIKEAMTKEQYIEKAIQKYNQLRQIALSLKNNNLDIPLREMSNTPCQIDPEVIIKKPIIRIK